jgi:hypothetical protein
MTKPVRILSIDGGGIRGVAPALVLAQIESITRKPIAELFDLIAGTSTGGILALGLVKPGGDGRPEHSAADLVSLYEQEGRRIFHRSVLWRALSLDNMAGQKYEAGGIQSVLEKYFGGTRLREALTEVIITSYETERRIPFFFKSRNARSKEGYDFPMTEVARATSAAPTYFEPIKLPSGTPNDYYSLIDGGVFANNPAMCAYVEARATHPERPEFRLVSLGSGELRRPLVYGRIRRWGLARWTQPILDVALGGVASTVDYQLRQLLPPSSDGVRRYWRFQVRLDEDHDKTDDAGWDNLRALRLLTESMIHERLDDLKLLCETLVA